MANTYAWGFDDDLRPQAASLVQSIQPQVIDDNIQRLVDGYNAESRTYSLFYETTIDTTLRYRTPGQMRNQPLDATGIALAQRGQGYYDVGFPIRRSGNAIGWDWETLQYMTLADVNDKIQAMLIGDQLWRRDHMLAALFTNVTYNFIDEAAGTIVVQPIANGDATTLYLRTNGTAASTDTHFLFQAAAIADATNPLPTIYSELTEHPDNAGQVVLIHGTDLTDDFMGLAGFATRADTNITPGTATDVLTGSLNADVPGRVYGYANGVWLSEWAAMPANYAIAVMTQSGEAPLKMREPRVNTLRGFRQVGTREMFPWYERQYRRYAGFGANNRVGAVVVKFGAASYTIPAGYQAPLPN